MTGTKFYHFYLNIVQGNVSYECPSIHAMFGIECPPGVANHTPGFTACAGTDASHDRAVTNGKAMAVAGWKVLTDDSIARKVREGFEEDKGALEEMAIAFDRT